MTGSGFLCAKKSGRMSSAGNPAGPYERDAKKTGRRIVCPDGAQDDTRRFRRPPEPDHFLYSLAKTRLVTLSLPLS